MTWAVLDPITDYVVRLDFGIDQPEPSALDVGAVTVWPTRPNSSVRLVVESGELVWLDPRTLAQKKTARIAEMRVAREAAIASGFVWDTSPFDSDSTSQMRLMGLALAAQDLDYDPKTWRLADNSWRTLDAEDAADVWVALQEHIATHFTAFALLEVDINAATTAAEVDAIDWGV